ncbi:UDP-3-O-(3-hydroxymyristoyl)glucosamine N-acyltransferase [bacterium]|jgi:UDP-3-O-[3-hydroxymyristoyl] glucosamine N-acyltransferase|nr:UDP-3-O-(3-hydroxymyristoyl)glucosamine N-acyltransferase [bacterium]
MKLDKIATLCNGRLNGKPDTEITSFGNLVNPRKGEIIYIISPDYMEKAEITEAEAIIVPEGTRKSKKPTIEVKNPRVAFALVVELFSPEPKPELSIHNTAVIGKNCDIPKNVHIGPYAVISDNCSIGENSIIESHSFLGKNVKIGSGCRIFPGVTIYYNCILGNNIRIHSGVVIGSDGFGYEKDGGAYRKIPQVGNVVIEDNVELGANVTIDRAALGSTRIKNGTKIDNLVMIAHNVEIGKNTLIISQVGIAGSSKVGDNCILAGQVGVGNYAVIEDNVTVGAQCGIPMKKRLRSNEVYLGSPVRKMKEMAEIFALEGMLPRFFSKFKRLRKDLDEMKDQMETDIREKDKS